MNVQTPFGSRLIKDQKPFFPGQEEELRAELARVQRMSEIAGANEREISVLQETFMMMKDNSFTIERSATAALSVVEIFEVKSLLLLIDKVRKTADRVILPEEYVPGDITDLLDVLDPGKDRLNTFYIYDSFSDALARLRTEKKELERESRKEKKKRKNELRAETGLNLTPKFDITISKSDTERIKMIEETSALVKSEEDYMSVTYVLAPTEADNQIQQRMDQVTADIEEEELKVREDLSREIHKWADVLLDGCERIGKLDITLAKALYARKYRCVMPEITKEHIIEFTDGRQGVTCITGANMGGKTVSLKLVGMIAILAQYGYFVPAAQAKIGLSNFMQILIGDSQSIERGLSSFGSEMEELKEIMDNSRDRSLLLIDEIASGTNPAEGLALTKSITDYLKQQPFISLITTHFETVTEDPDVVNMQVTGLANADFDRLDKELRYANRRERIGIIQKYMDYRLTRVDNNREIPKDALNIAKMLGIDAKIIEKAKQYLN